jgi:hypothetical protein
VKLLIEAGADPSCSLEVFRRHGNQRAVDYLSRLAR